jgi:TolA-binding protein
MSDPQRLEDGDIGSFAQRLLEAAKESPGPTLKARMQKGLGLLEPAVPVATLGKAVATSWPVGVAVGLVTACLMVIPLAVLVRHRGPARVEAPKAAAPVSAQSGAPAVATSAPVDHSGMPESSASVPPGTLMDEIRLVDRARAEIVAGAPRLALDEIRRYSERYPHGAFDLEAMVLRIESLAAAGDLRAAKDLGRQFLKQHPNSLLSERVVAIVRRDSRSRN